jgi:twinkle protein
MTAPVLGPLGCEAFERRRISVETAVRFGIFTGRWEDGRVIPDPNGNVVAFPFQDHGAIVNEKYRAPGKKFSQRAGGKRTFWNADVLDDPALQSGQHALIITEGELDALSAIDCGFPLTVSVPDGAPPVKEGDDPENLDPLDPASEHAGKFEFLWNNRDRLKKIKRFILACDADAPGRRLAAELLRRLSASRCMFLTYPEGCKDLNEVLMKHGPERVTEALNGARPYPVRGLYRLSDYPEVEGLVTFNTGWWVLDRLLQIYAGEFMVVTGIPSHGKSTWVLNLLVNLARDYGLKSAIFSPEMGLVPFMRDKLRRIRSGQYGPDADYSEADAFIENNFLFIDSDPGGMDEQDFDLDWIIERATDAVLRDGVRLLLIDPWNEVEHCRRREETGTEYIGRAIRQLKRFAHVHGVAVIVVTHPTKEVGKDGKGRAPTLYDIDGSAHWFNKPDHGIIIDRPNEEVNETMIRVAKVRFDETGEKGRVLMSFDKPSCRFTTLDRTASATSQGG